MVKISGGNGSGATAEAKLTTVPHEVSFDASGIGSARIGVDTSTIDSPHLTNLEQVRELYTRPLVKRHWLV